MVRRYTLDRVEYYRSWTPVDKECMMAKSVTNDGDLLDDVFRVQED